MCITASSINNKHLLKYLSLLHTSIIGLSNLNISLWFDLILK